MGVHIRPGPMLGIAGLFGLLAIGVGQCASGSSDAPPAAFGEPVPPAIFPAPTRPDPRTTTARTATTLLPATIPPSPTSATVLPTVPPTTPPVATAPATIAPVATAPATVPPAPVPTVAAAPPVPSAATPPVAAVADPPPPPPPPPPVTEPPAPTTTAAPPAPVSDAVALVNEQRAAAGLPALSENAALADAARAHAIDQASRQEMTHVGSDGSNAGDRIARAGYAPSAWAENVAAGYPTSASVIDGWMTSSGHRENMLSPSFTVIGIASAEAGDGTRYWTLVLAA